MSRFRVYIKPFEDSTSYASSFIEVTDDVNLSSLSKIKREIDSTEYNAGVFKYSNFGLKLSNEHGRYSDINVSQSIFNYKVSDSIVRVTWNANAFEEPLAGQAFTASEVTLFEGLLNDDATVLDLSSHEANFKCLGYESLFDRMEVPFSGLLAGDTFKEIIYDCLNQAPFNTLVTVDLANIDPPVNSVTDAVADLENKTVKEALDDLLILSNSILYIDANTVYVVDRSESATLQYTFYGQASNIGIENIQNISKIRRGLNRIFNYWTWGESTNLSQDTTSVTKYGVRKKQIGSDIITNSSKKDTILVALKNEFRNPKQEFDLTAKVNDDRVALKILDKVQIDYPTVFKPAIEGDPLPLWGQVTWGSFRYPYGEWSLTLTTDTDYKIIGIAYDIKNGTITYRIREA